MHIAAKHSLCQSTFAAEETTGVGRGSPPYRHHCLNSGRPTGLLAEYQAITRPIPEASTIIQRTDRSNG